MLSSWLRRAETASAPLIEIHRRYSATCYDLKLTVANDADGWSVEVRDRNRGEKLHSARRCSLAAAKLAATEFAVVRMTGGRGAATVEVMAEHLPWNESWQ